MIGTEEKKGTQKEVTIDRKANLKSHRLYWIGRRAQDIFFSALALIALSPVMLVTALAVVVDDPSGSRFSPKKELVGMESWSSSTSSVLCVWMPKQSWSTTGTELDGWSVL